MIIRVLAAAALLAATADEATVRRMMQEKLRGGAQIHAANKRI